MAERQVVVPYKVEARPLEEAAIVAERGRKDDGITGSGTMKDRYDLIPQKLIRYVAQVLSFGAQKYAPNSWQQVPLGAFRYKAALERHWGAMLDGEYTDPESGLPHAAHVVTNAIFAAYLMMSPEDRACMMEDESLHPLNKG